jgi:ribonucleotide reductase alpha subunit
MKSKTVLVALWMECSLKMSEINYGEALGWELGVDFPVWANTEIYVKTISRGYLLEGETPKDAYWRVATAVARRLRKPELASKFFDYIWRGWLCLASPVLSNTGTERGLPISCYTLDTGDSIQEIGSKNLEMMLLAKHGGGVGVGMNQIRPAGSTISQNGTSDGVVPFLKIFDSSILATSQGNVRRGAAVINLNIDHDDFYDFLEIREPKGDVNRQCLNLHQCVVVGDKFMRRLQEGDTEARRRWVKLLRKRKATGEPYIMFKGTVNKKNPIAYKKNGLKVFNTNLCCLTGDTLIPTLEGVAPISKLVGKEVTIFDGHNWVQNSSFEEKGQTTELIEVTTSGGHSIRCTPNHRWFVFRTPEDIRANKLRELLAEDLVEGDFIESRESGTPRRIRSLRRLQLETPVPVYCPTVPTTGKFALANGLMTGNSEILLHTDESHSFVCCLSSLNVARFEEWKDTNLVYDAVLFLDGVLEEFIQRAKNMRGFENVIRSANKGRALGLGVLGWHTYLQKNGIAFDTLPAQFATRKIFSLIQTESERASRDLADEYGEPLWCRDTGMRNTHLRAIAPTVTNSKLAGNVSPGIEPWAANLFTEQTSRGTFIRRNTVLEEVFRTIDAPDSVWEQILADGGSVQDLDCLDGWFYLRGVLTHQDDLPEEAHESELVSVKDVFKTFKEINQMELVKQAGIRQQFIDQGVSLNLAFPADASPKVINRIHMEAWKQGVKTLYYMRTESVLRGDIAAQAMNTDCVSCDG